MMYENIHGDAMAGPKVFHCTIVVNQQLSSIQLHVLKIEATKLERAQPTSCDELLGEYLDELDESTKLFPNKVTYY